jgi:hypothetical protein
MLGKLREPAQRPIMCGTRHFAVELMRIPRGATI